MQIRTLSVIFALFLVTTSSAFAKENENQNDHLVTQLEFGFEKDQNSLFFSKGGTAVPSSSRFLSREIFKYEGWSSFCNLEKPEAFEGKKVEFKKQNPIAVSHLSHGWEHYFFMLQEVFTLNATVLVDGKPVNHDFRLRCEAGSMTAVKNRGGMEKHNVQYALAKYMKFTTGSPASSPTVYSASILKNAERTISSRTIPHAEKINSTSGN
jgi:hypothetical protein